MINKRLIQIIWRSWHLCPLVTIGKYTGWLTNGIAFGKKYNPADNIYYLGWLILSVETKFHLDFVEQVNARTWPKGWIWIVKYGK